MYTFINIFIVPFLAIISAGFVLSLLWANRMEKLHKARNETTDSQFKQSQDSLVTISKNVDAIKGTVYSELLPNLKTLQSHIIQSTDVISAESLIKLLKNIDIKSARASVDIEAVRFGIIHDKVTVGFFVHHESDTDDLIMRSISVSSKITAPEINQWLLEFNAVLKSASIGIEHLGDQYFYMVQQTIPLRSIRLSSTLLFDQISRLMTVQEKLRYELTQKKFPWEEIAINEYSKHRNKVIAERVAAGNLEGGPTEARLL